MVGERYFYSRKNFIKAEGLLRAAYLFSSLSAPKDICSQMDKILFHFIWKNKPHKIKKRVSLLINYLMVS